MIFHFAIYILAFFSSLAILFSFPFFSNAVAVFIRSFRDELCAMHIAISICALFSSHSVFSLKKKTNGPFFLNDFWWMRATKVCVKWKIEKKSDTKESSSLQSKKRTSKQNLSHAKTFYSSNVMRHQVGSLFRLIFDALHTCISITHRKIKFLPRVNTIQTQRN